MPYGYVAGDAISIILTIVLGVVAFYTQYLLVKCSAMATKISDIPRMSRRLRASSKLLLAMQANVSVGLTLFCTKFLCALLALYL